METPKPAKLNDMRAVGRTDYRLLDVMKFLMAIFVIAIHRSPFSTENGMQFFIINVLVRVAVPFFFAASGFLFHEKLIRSKTQKSACLSYLKRLAGLYVIWSAIYFPAALYKNVIVGGMDAGAFGFFYLKNFFIGEGSFLHLWYLPSLMLSIMLVYLLSRRLTTGRVFLIAMLVCAAGLFCSNYSFVFGDHGVSAVVGSFSESFKIIFDTLSGGFVFTASGFLVSEKKEHLKKAFLIPGAAGSFLLMTAEAFLVSRYAVHYNSAVSIFLVPVTFFLTATAVSFNLRERKPYKFMRSANTLIYFSHLLIFQELFYSICFVLGLEALGYNRVFYFLITIAYSFVFSGVVIVLERKKAFRFLRQLH